EKEMYTFTPGSDTITLRPEGTAGVVRAYLQHNFHKNPSLTKFWYGGPMFRRERPQKGRQRQFHQVGVEAIGSTDPLLDAEVIKSAYDYYQALGIGGVTIKLNSIGCQAPDCRPAYREVLRKAIQPELSNLCKNCQSRFERNILRILDCKNPKCQEIRGQFPRSDAHLCRECKTHHAVVCEALTASGIEFIQDPYIVRGLDYYTRTVFEFSHSALGAQDAIGAGGRYDGLIAELGGPPTPAVGFAIGIERVLIVMEALDCCACQSPLQIFAVAVEETCRQAMMGLLSRLRSLGFSADMDFEGRSMKAQMKKANRLGAAVVLILGPDELSAGEVTVKDMREDGEQRRVALGEIEAVVKTFLKAG
ncbi:MAG: histidine--tRNA ligase, partial [Planctomycetes bacterium]|nr:histidine--tRNA ligase [Planctomycetota bacterium]